MIKAVRKTGITRLALAGGVSANSRLRARIEDEGRKRKWEVYLPQMRFTTDNAAMIAVTGYYKWKAGQTTGLDVAPVTRSIEMND